MIDRFATDVTSINTTQNETLSGIFGYAEINLSVRVSCNVNFFGPNCDMLDSEFTSTATSPTTPDPMEADVVNNAVVIPLVILPSLLVVALSVIIPLAAFSRRRRSKSASAQFRVAYTDIINDEDGSRSAGGVVAIDDVSCSVLISQHSFMFIFVCV